METSDDQFPVELLEDYSYFYDIQINLYRNQYNRFDGNVINIEYFNQSDDEEKVVMHLYFKKEK